MQIDIQSETNVHNLADRIQIKYKEKHLYDSYESIFDESNQIDEEKAASEGYFSIHIIFAFCKSKCIFDFNKIQLHLFLKETL